MRYFVTIEFEFESDTEDTLDFTQEAWDVFAGIEFVDRFESDTYCAAFTITEVNT